MPSQTRLCRYCRKPFVASRLHPGQYACTAPECQRRRRCEYHREMRRSDPDYRLVCRDGCSKWRSRHPDYQRRYRTAHPEYVDRNRQAQRRRDRKRRLRDLVKNNVAFDLKHSQADVWLAGPAVEDLVKNNFAVSEVMILQSLGASLIPRDASCKEHPAVFANPGGL